MSHAIWKMHRQDRTPELDSDQVERIIENETLPNPAEQINNLILWLGRNTPALGHYIEVRDITHRAKVGALNAENFVHVVRAAVESASFVEPDPMWSQNWFNVFQQQHLMTLALTLQGWEYYERLERSVEDSRRAFMAMKFRDADLDWMLENCFKLAVEQTGFSLKPLDAEPEAGLIDVSMEVAIRNARFVVADITHGNPGVYWEAGFAHGLGKPVIYTCEESEWEKKAHFDVNHRQTVIWNRRKPEDAAKRLKAVIRATLPTEAKMEDETASST